MPMYPQSRRAGRSSTCESVGAMSETHKLDEVSEETHDCEPNCYSLADSEVFYSHERRRDTSAHRWLSVSWKGVSAAFEKLTFLIWLCTSCKELQQRSHVSWSPASMASVPLPPPHLVALFDKALRRFCEFLDGVHGCRSSSL